MGGILFPFNLLELLETALSRMALSQPSERYLWVALATSVNATLLWYLLLDTRRFPKIERFVTPIAWIHRVMLWIGFVYISLRFPLLAFAAPPYAVGHTLFGMVMYSLLFAPLWVGLVILAWKMTRRCHYRAGVPPFRLRRAAIILSVIGWWGSIGELRALLNPNLLKELGRFPS